MLDRRNFLAAASAALVLPNRESPFVRDVQERIWKLVGEIMNEEVKPEDVPDVLRSERLTDAEFNKLIGFEARSGARMNFYIPPKTVYLLDDSETHNLGHEYAHAVQYLYQGYTKEDASSDYLEDAAVAVQQKIRELYLR